MGLGAGFTFKLSDAGSGNIDLVTLSPAIPEPATPLLMALGLVGIAGWRLRAGARLRAAG